MKILFTVLSIGISANSAFAEGNPHGYFVEVISEKAAVVRNANKEKIRRLSCNAGLQADGTYFVNCAKDKNRGAEFKAVLVYDSSENQWGGLPNSGSLLLKGQAPLSLDCSAAGTVPGGVPSFNLFTCTYSEPAQ